MLHVYIMYIRPNPELGHGVLPEGFSAASTMFQGTRVLAHNHVEL